MSVSNKRLGEIGLHILSFSDMPLDEWLAFFKNEEEVKSALEDSQGFIARTPDASDVRDALHGRLVPKTEELAPAPQEVFQQASAPDIVHAVDAQVQQTVALAAQQVQPTVTGQTMPSVVQQPMVQHVQQVQAVATLPAILTTDKGAIYDLTALKAKLASIYNSVDEFTDLFNTACDLADLDVTVDYISEAAKKRLVKHVKACVKGA